MQCRDFRQSVQDWVDGELAAVDAACLDAHAETCPDCAALAADYRNLKAALREMPTPEPPAGLTERLVRRVPAADRRRRATAAVAAVTVMAALMLPWLGQRHPAAPVGHSETALRVPVNADKTVSLSLASVRDLEGVTLTLELPEHVELAGYPSEHRRRWRTDLHAGQNRLRLPLHARRSGSGELVARIEHEGETREIRVRLDSLGDDQSRRGLPAATRLAIARGAWRA